MAREKKADEGGASADWMGTYGDLVTLLMCFFVLLYSMSNLDAEKFAAMAASFSNSQSNLLSDASTSQSIIGESASGIMDVPLPMPGTSEFDGNKGQAAAASANNELKTMASDFKTYFAQKNLQSSITVTSEVDYITLAFTDGMLFDVGKATLREEVLPILSQIADELAKYPENEISIEGHSDSDPINTPIFPSNMHLSSFRAISVFEYFVNEKQLDPERMAAAGRGEYRPIAPNDTLENKAKNRRVEITIYGKSYNGTN